MEIDIAIFPSFLCVCGCLSCQEILPKRKNTLLSSAHTPLLMWNVWGFLPHQPILQISRHQVRVLQFDFGTNYLELSQTLQVKGSIPQDCPPL